MAETAEKCAGNYEISREEQDRYALRSQQSADGRGNRGGSPTKSFL
jgi:acetyl-CoA acetyltransferase